MIQGIRQPAANESRADIRTGVNQTEEQCIVDAGASNTEELWHGQIRAIGAGLIPTLDSRTDRASDDGEIERPGLVPLVQNLAAECGGLLLRKGKFPSEILVVGGILRDKRPLLDQMKVVGEILVGSELLNITEKRIARDTRKWVLDSGITVRFCRMNGFGRHVTMFAMRLSGQGSLETAVQGQLQNCRREGGVCAPNQLCATPTSRLFG